MRKQGEKSPSDAINAHVEEGEAQIISGAAAAEAKGLSWVVVRKRRHKAKSPEGLPDLNDSVIDTSASLNESRYEPLLTTRCVAAPHSPIAMLGDKEVQSGVKHTGGGGRESSSPIEAPRSSSEGQKNVAISYASKVRVGLQKLNAEEDPFVLAKPSSVRTATTIVPKAGQSSNLADLWSKMVSVPSRGSTSRDYDSDGAEGRRKQVWENDFSESDPEDRYHFSPRYEYPYTKRFED